MPENVYMTKFNCSFTRSLNTLYCGQLFAINTEMKAEEIKKIDASYWWNEKIVIFSVDSQFFWFPNIYIQLVRITFFCWSLYSVGSAPCGANRLYEVSALLGVVLARPMVPRGMAAGVSGRKGVGGGKRPLNISEWSVASRVDTQCATGCRPGNVETSLV